MPTTLAGSRGRMGGSAIIFMLCPSLAVHRYILEDWSGSIMTSLRPVATKSASSKGNVVNDSHWGGEAVLTSKVRDCGVVCGWACMWVGGCA